MITGKDQPGSPSTFTVITLTTETRTDCGFGGVWQEAKKETQLVHCFYTTNEGRK